jgi:hypothetical protein
MEAVGQRVCGQPVVAKVSSQELPLDAARITSTLRAVSAVRLARFINRIGKNTAGSRFGARALLSESRNEPAASPAMRP